MDPTVCLLGFVNPRHMCMHLVHQTGSNCPNSLLAVLVVPLNGLLKPARKQQITAQHAIAGAPQGIFEGHAWCFTTPAGELRMHSKLVSASSDSIISQHDELACMLC